MIPLRCLLRSTLHPAVLLCLLATAACAPLPERSALPLTQRASPNFDERRPAFVVLHHTGSDKASRALSTLTDPARSVSSHYLIARDGTIFYLVDELKRAWHAGESYWGGHRDINSLSIGIELDNDGAEPFAEPQIEALLALLGDVRARYRIPPANILAHAEVAPRRKADPSRYFPWKRLAENGFGLWCESNSSAAPAGADGLLLLHAFGYDVSDASAAITAFKRRYAPDDSGASVLTEADIARLNCLLEQKQQSEG